MWLQCICNIMKSHFSRILVLSDKSVKQMHLLGSFYNVILSLRLNEERKECLSVAYYNS
jgi:hypothetical protein